ncbi:MAG: tRNA pseudouridine(38-40) synthase TruA [Candidatus Eremiobacteraeota bacterium]|nr:tRNA pseudouridine(38-40) synthase TruA [Candidatus Eremiobacteraeota bacterium]
MTGRTALAAADTPAASGAEAACRGETAEGYDDRRTTIRFAVEYDGENFCGFQWQPSVRTVAGVLESALEKPLGEHVRVAGAGRTDAGVHATGQVVSFSTRARFPFERLAPALDSLLPADIAVRDCTIVGNDFSARFSARERTYIYAILNRRTPSALLRGRAYHLWKPLDAGAMIRAATPLLGEHDFRAFCAAPPQGGVTVRTVRRLVVERHGDAIRIEIAADGFLHRMVRAIVGMLVECGRGDCDPATTGDLLRAQAPARAKRLAPAHGLYLAGVRYDGYDSFLEPPVF